MRKMLWVISAAISCYGLFSCNSNNPGESSAKAESAGFDKSRAKSFVDSINAKFEEQIASGDSVALASHYWPDAELLLDNSDVVKGKDIVNVWGQLIRMGGIEMKFSTTDITGSPTFIIETGNYEIKDNKKTLFDKGKYVVVWEMRNGEWKLYRDIGSTSLPPAK